MRPERNRRIDGLIRLLKKRWIVLVPIVAIVAVVGYLERPPPPLPRSRCLAIRPIDMVAIPVGNVVIGSEDFEPEERPVRTVRVPSFLIDRHEVTNSEFARFVSATRYVTLAERQAEWARQPEVPAEMRQPGGVVFRMPTGGKADVDRWWRWTPGAQWRHPEGPGSSIAGRDAFPVLQIAYPDAVAYARWRGNVLPTEAQWERAARGNAAHRKYIWGDDPYPHGRQMANSWQGVFPVKDTGADGFTSVAPAGCFPPNDFGLVDMAGNVWEWTRDNYASHTEVVGQIDGQAITIRGGSWLCSPNYCGRFRPAARQPGDPMIGTTHIGFRTVRDVGAGPPVR